MRWVLLSFNSGITFKIINQQEATGLLKSWLNRNKADKFRVNMKRAWWKATLGHGRSAKLLHGRNKAEKFWINLEKSIMKAQTRLWLWCQIVAWQEQGRQIQNKSEKSMVKWPNMMKFKKLPFAPDKGQKSPLLWHKWHETETVSPSLCKRDIVNPHSWEALVFLWLDDFWGFVLYPFQPQRWI